MVNLALEKRERVLTVQGKGRSEIGKVTEMLLLPWIAGRKVWSIWWMEGMASGKVEVLLVVSGLHMDRSMEA